MSRRDAWCRAAAVAVDGKNIGRVTSAAYRRRWPVIGLGYAHRDHRAGTKLTVGVETPVAGRSPRRPGRCHADRRGSLRRV
jgi:hypothetical protein